LVNVLNVICFIIKPKVLELIGINCKFLKRFESFHSNLWKLWKKNFNNFGLAFGQRLESVRFDGINEQILRPFLQLTNNLKALHMYYNKLNAKNLMKRRFSKIEEISFRLQHLIIKIWFYLQIILIQKSTNYAFISIDIIWLKIKTMIICDKFVVLKN
jgi:hypothetical protein